MSARALSGPASISGRLVRSSLRYLRERCGEATVAAVARELPQYPFLAAARVGDGWLPLSGWLLALAKFELRSGDVATMRLLREQTRATMAAAISTVWSTFMAGATPAELLERAGSLWSLSFDTGNLVVVERGPRRALLALTDWPSPPREIGAMVAEACQVFLARLGTTAPKALDEVVDGRLQIAASW